MMMIIIIIIIDLYTAVSCTQDNIYSKFPLSLEPAGTSPIPNRKLGIWINLFRSNMVARATRNYRSNVPNYMFTATDSRTFFIKPPRTYTNGRHRTLF